MTQFNCDKCGLCCKNLHLSELYHDLDRGDGICIHFNLETHMCSIYDNRPLKCQIDKMFNLHFSTQMTREQYYELNYKSCDDLKRTALKT